MCVSESASQTHSSSGAGGFGSCSGREELGRLFRRAARLAPTLPRSAGLPNNNNNKTNSNNNSHFSVPERPPRGTASEVCMSCWCMWQLLASRGTRHTRAGGAARRRREPCGRLGGPPWPCAGPACTIRGGPRPLPPGASPSCGPGTAARLSGSHRGNDNRIEAHSKKDSQTFGG